MYQQYARKGHTQPVFKGFCQWCYLGSVCNATTTNLKVACQIVQCATIIIIVPTKKSFFFVYLRF